MDLKNGHDQRSFLQSLEKSNVRIQRELCPGSYKGIQYSRRRREISKLICGAAYRQISELTSENLSKAMIGVQIYMFY